MSSLRKIAVSHLQTSTMLTGVMALIASAQAAHADAAIPDLPTGGKIVAGSGTLSTTAQTFTVNQSSHNLIADFDTFDIGAKNEVRVQARSSADNTLLRVQNSNRPSQILGKLTANDNVTLINSAGVWFGKGSEVNVGGLIATASDISNKDFMKGKYNFNKPGNADAKIVNEGSIKVADGGLALLVGPNVTNDGLIEANLGKVQLASGDTFSVDLYGDGLINLQASPQLTKELVKNSGKISANGGSVLLTTAAAQSTVDSLINMDGLIQANSVGTKNGKVVLLAQGTSSKKSTTVVSGKIDATGKTGGSVDVLGDRVALLDGANIDVSGANGGGTARIGGDYQGKGSVLNATQVVFSEGANVAANAVENGNGGKVIVWANDSTIFGGHIEAKGGAQGGNGGFVETSGKEFLDATGSVNASAANGNAGQWLLDPRNISVVFNISGGNVSGGTFNAGTGVFTPSANNSRIEAGVIQTALNGGTSVTLNTGTAASAGTDAGDINITTDISKTNGGIATLTLTAADDIIFSNGADISSSSNKLNVVLNAGDRVQFDAFSDVNTNNGDITSTSGRFINNSSTNVFTVGTGKWTVLTQTPDNNTLGGLTAANVRYGCTSTSACAGNAIGSGNSLLYSVRPNLTITPDAKTITYGDATPSFTSVITGVKNNDGHITANVNTGTAGYTTSSVANGAYVQGSNAGSYDITASAGTLSSSLGYSFTGATRTNGLTVNKKTVTAALTGAANSVSKVYNAQLGATLSSNNFALTGVYGTDNVFISNTSGTYDTKDVGSAKLVTVNSLILGGTKASNYNLTTTSASANVGEITQHGLTINIGNQSQTYAAGNVLTAGFTVQAGGLQGTDSVTAVTLATNATTSGSGNWNVSGETPWSITGSDASGANFNANNYNISYVAGNLTVTPKDITITATAAGKTYDGTRSASVTLDTHTLAGDNVTGVHGEARFSDKNVADGKIVTVEGVNLSGDDADNYHVANQFNVALAQANITKRDLTLTASAENKTYDGSTSAAASLSDNRIEGDDLGFEYSANFDTKNVGEGKTVTVSGITIGGDDAGNYSFNDTATTTADITKRGLTISAKASNKTYDGTTTANVSLGDDRVEGDDLSKDFESANFDNKNVGVEKTVTVSGITISGDDAGNYSFNEETTTSADIVKRGLSVEITANNKTYDGTRTATLNIGDNRVEGDDLGFDYNAQFGDKNVGEGKAVTISSLSLTGEDAGNYNLNFKPNTGPLAITNVAFIPGFDGPTITNIGFIPGLDDPESNPPVIINEKPRYSANITPRSLTVTADPQTKVYGQADPTLTFTHDALQGEDTEAEVFGDGEGGIGSLVRDAGEHVANGPYAINQGSLLTNGNYTMDYVGNVLVITPASLTVTADNQSVITGGTLPTLTYQVTGFQFEDTANTVLSGALQTVATTSPAGVYDINQGTLAANSDYVIQPYVPGVLTILPSSDINATQLQGNGPNGLPGGPGQSKTLLSITNGGGNGGNTGGNFGGLEPAAGGENPGGLEPSAGGNTTSLIDCTPETPCEATE